MARTPEHDQGKAANISLEHAYREGLITDAEVGEATSGEVYEMLVSVSPVAALRMADTFGGMQVRVPMKPQENSVFREGVGEEFAEQVCHLFGMCVIYVPKLSGLRRTLRDRRIWQMTSAGHSVTEIAQRFGLSQRGVWMALSRQRQQHQEQ